MVKPKRTFTAEFKRDTMALADRGDRSVAQIERDLGLSAGCLRHWRADAIRASLTHLAVERKVAASTWNVARSAVLFLRREDNP